MDSLSREQIEELIRQMDKAANEAKAEYEHKVDAVEGIRFARIEDFQSKVLDLGTLLGERLAYRQVSSILRKVLDTPS